MKKPYRNMIELSGTEKVVQYPNKVHHKPLVSVCVQTYKHEKYIKQCLDGILMQKTNFEYEILLGEDDSPDKTREICINYAEKFPQKIRLFLHDRSNVIYLDDNPTGRYNFIYNLINANGKYIALCEGDDYWTDPYKLQKQIDFLESNSDYVLCFHDATVRDSSGNLISDSLLKSNKIDFTKEDLVCGGGIITVSVVFRNSKTIIPSNFTKSINGDTVLYSWLGQYGKGKRLSNVENAVYRKHVGGIWSSKDNEYQFSNKLKTLNHMIENTPIIYKITLLNRKKEIIKNRIFQLLKDKDFSNYAITSRNLIRNKDLNLKEFILLHFKAIFKYRFNFE